MGKRTPRSAERGQRWMIRRASVVLLITAGVVALSLAQIVDLRSGRPLIALDLSVDAMLPEAGEDRLYYEEIQRLFGAGEVVLLALVADDIFSFDNLTRIQQISEAIENLEQVERVTSLSLSSKVRSEQGALVSEPLYEAVPRSRAGLAELRARALSDPITAGNLVSADGRVAVVLAHSLDPEILASGLDQRIREIANSHWREGTFWMSGSAHVKAEMSRLVLRDSTFVVQIATLVMAMVALLAFRSLRGVLIPVATVAISALATLAVIACAYGSLNQITVAVPAIVIVVGFAYSIHIVSAYYDALRNPGRRGDDERSPARAAREAVSTAMLFTGFTTAAGFASFATSAFTSIQQFGIATSVGVLISMIVSLTFCPALLEVLPIPASRSTRAGTDRFDQSLVRLARFDIRHRTPILIAGAAVAVISALGLLQIVVGSDLVSSFEPEHPVRTDFDQINDRLDGANSFNVVLTTSVREGFKIPQNLLTLDALQLWLAAQPEVGGSTSLADYVKALHQGIQGGERAHYSIPENRDLVSQLLRIGDGDRDEIAHYVDAEFQTANVIVRTTAIDSIELLDLVERIEARLDEIPHHIQGRVTGNTVLLSRSMNEIAIGQARSLATAFVIIYLILVMLFTSFKTGLIALVPNVLPVLIFFGILGWSGIPLNTSTALIACIVLGIAVDDTIHLLVHFNRSAKRLADEKRGVIEAMRKVGRPVTFTTAALCLAFSCVVFSETQPQVEFGYLAAVTLLSAWLVDLTFTPALATRMQIVTIWDVLTLDLGEDPQLSIPLFAGLTATQARMTALLAQLVEFPQGHRVLRNGAAGNEMYVVIEGELRASLRRGEKQVVLRSHGRGDVVGEVALFHGTRTADVAASTDVRLLKITQADFENIQRRHPRIGAQLYANLNKVLADRMAELTDRAEHKLAFEDSFMDSFKDQRA